MEAERKKKAMGNKEMSDFIEKHQDFDVRENLRDINH